MTRMLFCNISWMDTYAGDPADQPVGGGSNPYKAEECNFKPVDGQLFGYVAAGPHRVIKIDRLGAEKDAPSVDSVDVVWTAPRPNQAGRVVVGWYREAKVFRHLQDPDRRPYHFTAAVANCILLEPTSRNIEVKMGNQIEGGAGRNVWFADSPYGQKLKRKIKKLFDQEFDRGQLNAKARRLIGGIGDPPKGFAKPLRKAQETVVYGRDPEVQAWVRQRAKGRCQLCGKCAPFVDSHNDPFLEVHHVKRLADGGADVPCNAVALCPNCHREAHYGTKWKAIRKKLKHTLKKLGT